MDVIVIGSGPAGYAAAFICAQKELEVMMLTDQVTSSMTITSNANCVESIHPGTISLLEKINAADIADKATRGKYKGIYSNGVYNPLGEDASGAWEGLHIDRASFDYHLLQRARETGIKIIEGEKVENILTDNNRIVGVQTHKQSFHSKYVIDASGKKSIAGKNLKFRQNFYAPPLICWTGIATCASDIPYDLNAAHFIPGDDTWTWLAPLSKRICAWTRLSLKGEKNFIAPKELGEAETTENIHFANMRWRMFRPLVKEGLILCGDAAGILDPAAGQGIFNALYSGIMAGNTAVNCIHQPDIEAFHLAQYDTWFSDQFDQKVNMLKTYYQNNNIRIM